MNYKHITEIKETTEESEVNKYLKEGYQIVKIFNSRTIVNEAEEAVRPIYVLGKIGKEN